MDMVERVARVLAASMCGSERKWKLYVPQAIAAIKAMREPSEGMVEACAGTEMIEKRLYAGAYRCMIDASLGEHK